MVNLRGSPALPLILLLLACAEPAPEWSGSLRFDSAGVEIVDHPEELMVAMPQWELAATPTVAVGTIHGPEEYQLYGVQGGSVLPGDTILVVNGGSQELRFYDPEGQFIRSVGGNGEGPGEFRSPGWFCHFGDSIAVWDHSLGRLAVFDRQGEFKRQTSPRRNGRSASVLGVFSDGSMLVQGPWVEGLDGSMSQRYLHLALFDRDGVFLDSLPAQPFGLLGRLGNSGVEGGPLFGSRTSTAVDSEFYWIGTGSAPQVSRYSPHGELIQIVRWADEERSVSQDEIDHYADKEFARVAEAQRGLAEEIWRSIPISETFPVFERLETTREGGLWIKLYRRPMDDGPDRWLIADESGGIVARIQTPRDFRMMEIGEDYVAGVFLDELDVEYFAVFTILRDREQTN